MRVRLLLASLAIFGAGASVAIGCNLEPDSNYGNASGLSHQNLPSPPAAEGGSSGGDGGALCNGMGAIDGGPCPVKFSTDIWPMMSASGKWQCADSACHGGTAQSPFINDPASAYNNLVAYKIGGKPYVNPCSIDPDASTFACNLQGTCGIQGMPIPNPPARPAAQATDIGKVVTWAQCGAPNN